MRTKLLVCRVAWMDHYRGVGKDPMYWKGRKIVYRNWWEMYNFEPCRGRYYGGVYLQRNGHPMTIHVDERLGARDDADRVNGVTVVWAAVRPGHGLVVVGWYGDATVYRRRQPLEAGGLSRHYYVTAKTTDSELLDLDQRLLPVPTGKGFMGRHNTWVPGEKSAFATRVRECIADFRRTGRFLPEQAAAKGRPGRAWQPNLKKRLAVEHAAVTCVAEHYERAGYTVEFREEENLGWDLEARRKGVSLKLEVKGLSETGGVTELTQNEYEMSLSYQDDYRICIVTSVLEKPMLHVFHYSEPRKVWTDDEAAKLGFEVITIKIARLRIGG